MTAISTNYPTAHSLNRKGVSWDTRAKQFTCRVGYRFNEVGARVRDFQYLTADPDDATIRHITLGKRWEADCNRWPALVQVIRLGLPDPLKSADLSKPVWIKEEWLTAGRATMEGQLQAWEQERADVAGQLAADAAEQALFNARVSQASRARADEALDTVRSIAGSPLMPKLNERSRTAIAEALYDPAAHGGVTPRRLSIRQAADEFAAYKESKIGLIIPGLKRGGGLKAHSFNGIKRELNYALKHLDETASLDTLTHERLEHFRDQCYRAAQSPRTAFNLAKALKGMLDWADRNRTVAYAAPETINDVFALARPETTKKLTYDAATVAKLKAMKAAAEKTVKQGGEPVWVFGLLGLNAACYPSDAASWTYDNLKFTDDGRPYLWWQRQKTSHQNTTLYTRHDLWPETWAAVQGAMAPDDPATNPMRYLFLTRLGQPMYRTAKGRARLDVIGLRWKRCADKAISGQDEAGKDVQGVDLPYAQLRKVALNAVKKAAGGSDDVVRKFAGQKVPGMLKAYLSDDFDDVAGALTKFREVLRAHGVL